MIILCANLLQELFLAKDTHNLQESKGLVNLFLGLDVVTDRYGTAQTL